MISKMPVQNSNFKISDSPDLAINLLQIIIPTIFDCLLCQKGQFTLQLCPKRWFVRKYLFITPTHQKVNIKNSLQIFLPVPKGGYQETACFLTGRKGPV